MKIGPVELRRYAKADQAKGQAPPPETRPERRELGATGTTFFSGLLTNEEYNNDLKGKAGLTIFDRMFKSDPTVRAVDRAITLPIRSATYAVTPASDSAADKEIAEFVENVLFGLTSTWDTNVRHFLYALRYGHYPFEQVWEERDGRYVLRKFAPRHPRTISRWFFDDHGGLAGLQQRTWKLSKEGSGFGVTPAGRFETVDIPIERLLIMVNEQEGSNYEGESIARPMYKPWYYKEGVERVLAIGSERREVGVEYAKMNESATKEHENAVATALASLHAQEQGYIIFPPTVEESGVMGQGAGRPNTMAFLEYLKREIAVSGLAEFVAIGGGDTGSWAMVRDKSSFFLLADRAVADGMTQTVDRHAIKRLVDVNFKVEQDKYPTLQVSRLETRNMKDYAAALFSLADKGFLTPDRVIEEALRSEMDLPELAEDVERIEDKPEPEIGPGPVPQGEPPEEEDEEGNNADRPARLRALQRRRSFRGHSPKY